MREWTFGCHKMRGTSWLAKDLLASQGLCSMWVSCLYTRDKFCSFNFVVGLWDIKFIEIRSSWVDNFLWQRFVASLFLWISYALSELHLWPSVLSFPSQLSFTFTIRKKYTAYNSQSSLRVLDIYKSYRKCCYFSKWYKTCVLSYAFCFSTWIHSN
jgi:hypothetical protein